MRLQRLIVYYRREDVIRSECNKSEGSGSESSRSECRRLNVIPYGNIIRQPTLFMN